MIALWVYYKRTEAGQAADKIVRRYRGVSFGGGTNLRTGERDESYEFRTLASAIKARDAIKTARLRGVRVKLCS